MEKNLSLNNTKRADGRDYGILYTYVRGGQKTTRVRMPLTIAEANKDYSQYRCSGLYVSVSLVKCYKGADGKVRISRVIV